MTVQYHGYTGTEANANLDAIVASILAESTARVAADVPTNKQWGQAPATTTGLTYGYFGGAAYSAAGVLATAADGTVLLTANATNYVERTILGAVSANVAGFTASRLPMAIVVAGAAGIASVSDQRNGMLGYYPPRAGEAGVTDVRYPCGHVIRYGGIGNFTADDSVAVHASFDAAKTFQVKAYFPTGRWRVTTSYTQATAYGDVVIEGDSASRENNNQGSILILDSADPAVWFYRVTARHHIQARNITFQCTQYALDRPFFKYDAPHYETFSNVNFESVERPVVWGLGGYFQNASYRDVQFRNSGTFHSESAGTVAAPTAQTLIGTLFLLDNVNHEGNVPINSDKILCNLSGIRTIQGKLLLLEGAMPSAGWTVLRTDTAADASWARPPIATIHGLHIEWSGAYPPAISIDQIGGTITLENPNGYCSDTMPHKLSSKATAIIKDASYAGAATAPSTYFTFGDTGCKAIIENSQLRTVFDLASNAVQYDRATLQANGNAGEDRLGDATISNTGHGLIAQWEGGFADGDLLSLLAFSANTILPSTDATYGRKLLITPSASVLNAAIRVKPRGIVTAGDQVNIVVTFLLPAFTTGFIALSAQIDGASIWTTSLDNTYSGRVLSMIIPVRLAATPATSIGFSMLAAAATGLLNPMEIYGIRFFVGNTAPRYAYPIYPKNVVMKAAAIPTTGTWAVGDVCYSTAAASGSPLGWYCTVAGTPGTWLPFGIVGETRASALVNVATADATDLASAIALVNALKTSYNTLLTNRRTANEQA